MNEDDIKREVEEKLREIDSEYSAESYLSRLRKIVVGINKPRASKEYKEAVIELQRLGAPAAAVLIPVLLIGLLAILSSGSRVKERVVETQILEASTITDLAADEQPLDRPPDIDNDLAVDIPSGADSVHVQVEAPASTANAYSAKPQPFNAVMNIRSPVILRNVYGSTRSTGARGKSLRAFGGNARTEAAVMRALRWIKSRQSADGSWPGRGDGTSVTGLALLTLLAHGEIPGRSPEFGDNVRHAIEYLMRQPNHDAVSTHALSEAFGMTQNPNIKTVAVRSLTQMAARIADTKWGSPRDGDPAVRPDLLAMTFNVMALRSARLGHIDIPRMDEAFKKLKEGFLLQGNRKEGGFSSDYFGPPGPNYRRTGTWHFMVGVVGMQYLGAGADPIIPKTLDILDDLWPPPTLGCTDIACCPVRGNYWATMVFFNQGGKRWENWNQEMQAVYVPGQHVEKGKYTDPTGKPREIGYWLCEDMHIGQQPLIPTCYIALQLMVYYRYLPTSAKDVWEAKDLAPVVSAIDKDDIQVESGNL